MGSEDQPTAEFEGTGYHSEEAQAPPLIAAGRLIGDRYRLERRLGYGGMAAVWLATDERLDRPVAIKVLSDTLAHDQDYLSRFKREARVAAGLQHPNLVSVYDFDAGMRPYLVMEYVPGGDLDKRVRGGELPELEDLARELLEALAYIHAEGVLHRDIKPQNVLVDAEGHARLTDFGIALPRDATALTGTGRVIGTESYIAPEVMAGEAASERSDLFALGVVLGEVAREVRLQELIRRLRDPVPGRRPSSASVALTTLEREAGPQPAGTVTQPFAVLAPAEAEAGVEERPTAPRPFEPSPTGVRLGRQRRWSRLGILGLGAVLVALVVGLVLSSGGDDPEPRSQATAQGGGGGEGGEGATTPPSVDETVDETDAAATDASAGDVSEETSPEPVSADAQADGVALNDQGFALIGEQRYEEAVPVLEQAVEALRDSGDEQTYNYALFNLAQALRLSDRAEEAIPLLEERLQYDDQQDTVQAELDLARAEAEG